MHRRPSILSHRPKTSSAADDTSGPKRFDANMKRTASQTFNTHGHDVRDTGMSLGSVKEDTGVEYAPSSHSQATFSQAFVGNCKQICRRLSSSSSRRPSLSATSETSSFVYVQRPTSQDLPHPLLQHQDSGMPPPQEPAMPQIHSRFAAFKKGVFGSMRRRQVTSAAPADITRLNTSQSNIPPNLPLIPLYAGSAARASAAANNERLNIQKRDAEQTEKFLLKGGPTHMEDVMKDSESGVGMTCSSPIERVDSPLEKKADPLHVLPAEISQMIFSNLDASSLAFAERVSKRWRETASSPHVWRNVFLLEYTPKVHVSPTPIMMGGAGIGQFQHGKSTPGQNWKMMFRVRKEIEHKWRAGEPSAVYLNGHTDSVYCCQFDEDKIITGSRDRTIRVWDMKTYKCLKVIGGPANTPFPSTPHVLETHKETVVNLPSVNGTPEGRAIYQIPEDYHEASILCLQYDDEIMVTGSSDHTCIVWDITGKDYIPKFRLRRHTAGVLDVCLDDKHIISCSKDLTINVWDRATGEHLRELAGHRGPVNAVQLRGDLLVSASGDGVAKLWNLDSGVCIREFPSQERGLAAVEFSDDAKYVLAGGNDHVVYKFDALQGNLLHTSLRHGGLVRSLFLDAHNGRVISGSYDQSIRIADYDSGVVFGLYENWTTSWILSAKSDYRRVVATSQDGRALILDFGWKVTGKESLIGKQER